MTQEVQNTETQAATPAAPAAQVEELKVVIQLKGKRAIIVVGTAGCDPVIHMADATTYSNLWVEVENAITLARSQWTQAKQYPADKAPPAPPRPAVATKPRVATTAKGKPAQEQVVQHGLPML